MWALDEREVDLEEREDILTQAEASHKSKQATDLATLEAARVGLAKRAAAVQAAEESARERDAKADSAVRVQALWRGQRGRAVAQREAVMSEKVGRHRVCVV